MDIRKNRKQLSKIKWPKNSLTANNDCSVKKGNKHMKSVFFLLFVFVFFTSVTAKPVTLTAKYKIYMFGSNVGEFSVVQKTIDGNVTIDAITEVEIGFIFSYRIKYVQKTEYKQGVLQKAKVKTYKNGKLNSTMNLKYVNKRYILTIDGETSTIKELIIYSGSLIYFNEPKGITRIFKERNAEMRQISPEGNHIYVIKDEKGELLNRYFYKNGVLQKATMRHTLATVELIRVNE
ncbi:MAG: DUF6134 family protein [Bacteroidota bacterium]|nr:DUF6134 family protein [Bacteroidota bacterium]